MVVRKVRAEEQSRIMNRIIEGQGGVRHGKRKKREDEKYKYFHHFPTLTFLSHPSRFPLPFPFLIEYNPLPPFNLL